MRMQFFIWKRLPSRFVEAPIEVLREEHIETNQRGGDVYTVGGLRM
jgi:hypothetical protein